MFLFFFIVSIVALCLAFLHAVFGVLGSMQNHNQSSSYNFIFAWIWLVMAIVLLITVAVWFRDIGTISKKRSIDCQNSAAYAHEKEYRGFCDGKYLDAGNTCRKQDFTQRWEASNELRSLNPVCCPVAQDVLIWPFFICGIWLCFLLLAAFLAGIASMGLSDILCDDDPIYKQLKIADFIVIAVLLLLALGIGLWLIFRSTPSFKNRYSESKIPGFNVQNGQLVPNGTFKPTNSQQTQVQQLPNGCYRMTDVSVPDLQTDDKTCNASNCGFSAGLMVTNGYFDKT